MDPIPDLTTIAGVASFTMLVVALLKLARPTIHGTSTVIWTIAVAVSSSVLWTLLQAPTEAGLAVATAVLRGFAAAAAALTVANAVRAPASQKPE